VTVEVEGRQEGEGSSVGGHYLAKLLRGLLGESLMGNHYISSSLAHFCAHDQPTSPQSSTACPLSARLHFPAPPRPSSPFPRKGFHNLNQVSARGSLTNHIIVLTILQYSRAVIDKTLSSPCAVVLFWVMYFLGGDYLNCG